MTLPNGYELKTTFWEDFTIADHFGKEAIIDTFVRAFKEWKKDVTYLTELALVTNWKSWQWESRNNEYCDIYVKLYYKVNDYALDNLKGKDLNYYFNITD